MSICLDLFSVTGLDTMKIDPWLSPQMGIAFRLKPISCKSVLTYTTWWLQSDSAIYSASVEDNATVF